MKRSDGRGPLDLRPVRFQRGFTRSAPGSVVLEMGRTKVLCTATVVPEVPAWLEGTSQGWLTAEYGMLPASTGQRKPRRTDGRSVEIQRVLGRALRAMIDRSQIGRHTIWVDCDVLEADGGTRTAAITGACVAVVDALQAMRREGLLDGKDPLRHLVAAVSVGLIDGEVLVDLSYEEDSRAETDLNLAMTDGGDFVEVQGTAEGAPISRESLDRLLDAGRDAVRRLIQLQREALPDVRLPGRPA